MLPDAVLALGVCAALALMTTLVCCHPVLDYVPWVARLDRMKAAIEAAPYVHPSCPRLRS